MFNKGFTRAARIVEMVGAALHQQSFGVDPCPNRNAQVLSVLLPSGGPTLLMSVHPLILAKCSQNRQTKIYKNIQKLFFCALKVPGCLLLMRVHLKWYVNHIGYDWECF